MAGYEQSVSKLDRKYPPPPAFKPRDPGVPAHLSNRYGMGTLVPLCKPRYHGPNMQIA